MRDANSISTLLDETPPWLSLLACPDCRGTLTFERGHLVCDACQRQFEQIEGGYGLLPLGVAPPTDQAAPAGTSLRSRFIGAIYTRHNRSRQVRQALAEVLESLGEEGWGLCLGSAETRLHPRLINLDIRPGRSVDVQGTAHRLPLADASMRCMVSQEVFEHLPDPLTATQEVARVLAPDGIFYLQTPFLIGVHGIPHDYWRFTDRGLRQLLEDQGFTVCRTGPAVGAGTSAYRIGVELIATVFASICRPFYMPAKAAASVVLTPLRWLDYLTTLDNHVNRIPAGFYAIARKKEV